MHHSGVRAFAMLPCRAVAPSAMPSRAVMMVPDGTFNVLLVVVQVGARRFGTGGMWMGSRCAVLSIMAQMFMMTDIECSLLSSARFAVQVVRSSTHGFTVAPARRFSISGASFWVVGLAGLSGVWFWFGPCRCRWDCC